MPHVVVGGPARSMGRDLGVTGWSKWLAVGRAATRIEGEVLRVILVEPAQPTRCSSGTSGWSKWLAAGRWVLRLGVSLPHVVVAGSVRSRKPPKTGGSARTNNASLKPERGWLVEGARDRPGADVHRGRSAARCSQRSGAADVSRLELGLLVEVARGRPGSHAYRG